ncbi:hypothetical protein TCON_2761, partial [Astathelohania contejeani]
SNYIYSPSRIASFRLFATLIKEIDISFKTTINNIHDKTSIKNSSVYEIAHTYISESLKSNIFNLKNLFHSNKDQMVITKIIEIISRYMCLTFLVYTKGNLNDLYGLLNVNKKKFSCVCQADHNSITGIKNKNSLANIISKYNKNLKGITKDCIGYKNKEESIIGLNKMELQRISRLLVDNDKIPGENMIRIMFTVFPKNIFDLNEIINFSVKWAPRLSNIFQNKTESKDDYDIIGYNFVCNTMSLDSIAQQTLKYFESINNTNRNIMVLKINPDGNLIGHVMKNILKREQDKLFSEIQLSPSSDKKKLSEYKNLEYSHIKNQKEKNSNKIIMRDNFVKNESIDQEINISQSTIINDFIKKDIKIIKHVLKNLIQENVDNQLYVVVSQKHSKDNLKKYIAVTLSSFMRQSEDSFNKTCEISYKALINNIEIYKKSIMEYFKDEKSSVMIFDGDNINDEKINKIILGKLNK